MSAANLLLAANGTRTDGQTIAHRYSAYDLVALIAPIAFLLLLEEPSLRRCLNAAKLAHLLKRSVMF
ncbi:hypothetical protein X738_28740 [Mesorhizobium sp. LNHC209A00]|nr:hypothetical protein X738_28740 [Mesorhizobium sp. LNHC209A00]